jgi:preprotein translocase subunit SecE
MGAGGKNVTFAACLVRADVYKRNQGRLIRQLFAAALCVVACLLCWALGNTLLVDSQKLIATGVPVLLAAVGCWISYRVVNFERFADFLIDVQGEMVKVTWPGWGQLKRATGVVLGAMILLSSVLFICDIVWQGLLRSIHMLQF